MFSGLSTNELISMVNRGSKEDKDYAAGYAQALIDLFREGIIDVSLASARLNISEDAVKLLAEK